MSWAAPKLLWVLMLVPMLIVAFALDGQRRLRLLSRLGHVPAFQALMATLSPARRRFSVVLWVVGLSLILAALSMPRIPGRARLVQTRGLDIVVALDFSRSMLARDVYPSRLERAKNELGHLIDSLRGDRVGLVAFAGETMANPLTTDYDAAKHFWNELTPDDMPVGGTDIGRALKASVELLRGVERAGQKRKPSQVIILLTDGEDTEGHGIEAARQAHELGIRIYTIGIGTSDRPIIQTYDENGKPAGYLADDEGKPVRVGLDEAALRQIAQIGSGQYFALDPDRFGMERVQDAIAGLERTEEEARYEREPEDIGRFLLLPGFLLLIAQAAFRDRKSTRKKADDAAPAATGTRAASINRAAALVLAMFLPFMTGFDLFKRREPSIEIGNQALADGKNEEALAAYDKALVERPDDPVVHYNRGVALNALKRYPDAQKEFLHAAESRDVQLKADAYYNLGNTQLLAEHAKEAVDAYKHSLQLRPDDKRAKWNLEMAQRALAAQPPPPPQQQNQKPDDKHQKPEQKPDDKNQKPEQKPSEPKDQKSDQQKSDQQPPKSDKPDDKQQQQPKPDGKPDPKAPDKPDVDPRPEEAKGGDPKNDDKKGRILPQPKDGSQIDKQDAEAVLDALERGEPTVQKELAKRRAGNRRARRDW